LRDSDAAAAAAAQPGRGGFFFFLELGFWSLKGVDMTRILSLLG
jgi:hypothetical protein